MDKILIFVDAAYHPDTGKTAIGYVKIYENGDITQFKGIAGYNHTNQRAELYAMIYALKQVKRPSEITVYTDCISTIEQANKSFFKRNNRDLWREYIKLLDWHVIEIEWIRRNSHPYAKRAHVLAKNRMSEFLETGK